MAYLFQSNCLICPVDKSGNFLAFRAETRKNTEKPEKTGFGTINETAPGPFFCVFGVKKIRTSYLKLTEQSSRKKLAAGGFEPEKVQPPYPAPRKNANLWGCANRIVNGRAVCDSHHINEDTLQNTYTAAIRDMIEDAEEIMAAVKESAGLVMEPENRAALDRITANSQIIRL